MLRKHEPVTEKEMEWISPNNSICQLLREIYHKTDDPDIRLNCRVATSMAKSMTRKLTEYKESWEEDFWDIHPENFKKILELQEKMEDGTRV
jgi:ABC-type Zn uptake system ZnuABC Zn-binding protein ZnuA